jgi:hypothetical protein
MTLVYWKKTDTTQKNTEALLDTSNEVGLEVNPEKTKYSKTWLIQNTRNQKKKFF